ncbi:Hypothetical protein PBC10988_32520 [Planctomycetales bacterium 10988]|nr:Hypothetical protein PBC10988_32520 [Planctomycetales bacterium 10988]
MPRVIREPAGWEIAMNEAEMRSLVKDQLAAFQDQRAMGAIRQWTLLVEPAPNGWLLYRIGEDLGIAYSLDESWQETPWAVVDGFSVDDPVVRTYCPDLEDAVCDVIYDGNPPPRQTELDARQAMMEKALQKRKRKRKGK